MKLFIPEIGTRLKLTTDWSFQLHHERRNEPLFKSLGLIMWNWGYQEPTPPPPVLASLPVGTVLIVDRIYIRNGKSDFSSVTFRASIPGEKTKKGSFGKTGVRFWAKLSDVNNIEFELFDLKPATENAAKKAEAKQLVLEAEYEAKKKHRDDLMAKVAAAEPLNLSTAELIKRGMENGLSFEIAIRRREDEFEAALLFDNLSRNLYGVGYAGCKKINYSPGDRVRYLGASRFGYSDVVPRGTLGTVFVNNQSKILEVFGHSSRQPKGIMVQWDEGCDEYFVYVTEVEPA